MEAVAALPVKPPTAVSSPSSTTREKLDLMQTVGNLLQCCSHSPGSGHLGQALPTIGSWVVHLQLNVDDLHQDDVDQ